MSRDLDMGGLTFVFVDSKNEVLETTKVGRNLLLLLIPFLSFSQQDVPDRYWVDDSNFEQAMKVIDCFKKHPNWFDKPRGIFANNRYYSNGWKTRDSGIDWKREYGW